jgi:hypothetical protein
MGIFAAIKLVASMLPAIIALIHAAEALFPGQGTGSAKLDHVLSQVAAGVSATGATLEQVEAMREPVTQLVGAVVDTFNSFDSWPAQSGSDG